MTLDTKKAIYGKLSGDSTLVALLGTAAAGYNKAIYYQQAPSDGAFPYVIFQQVSGVPTYDFGTGVAGVDSELWMIKGVDRSESADVADGIASRLDALLTDGTISISGATQLYLRRDSDLPSYSEVVDGNRYIHAGALFRLIFSR